MLFYRRRQPILAMSFDLDDTLYDNHPLIGRAEALTLSDMHQRFPQTRHTDTHYWRSIRNQLLSVAPELLSDMGQLRRQGLDIGLTEIGLCGKEKQAAIDEIFQQFYLHRSDFRVEGKIIQVLEQLARHYPLVAITNGNVNLEAIGLGHIFQFSLHASLEQPMKPHSCMFDLAARHLNLLPEQILHVGDNLEKDVMGALSAGYQSAWYAHNRPMDLRRESVSILPHIQLKHLSDLLNLCPDSEQA